MTSADELEQTYRRIYRRLVIGVFVAYAVVFGIGVTVLVAGPTSWWPDGGRQAQHVEAAMIRE